MKKALVDRQARLDIEVDNVLDTGIQSIEDALSIWRPLCTEMEPRKRKDGLYFLSRSILYIEPNSESKSLLCMNKYYTQTKQIKLKILSDTS